MAIGSQFQLAPFSTTPSPPPVGYLSFYVQGTTIYLQDSSGNIYSFGSTTAIGALVGDVLATGPGTATATVVAIQGSAVSATPPTDAQFLVWNTSLTRYNPIAISGDATMTNAGVLTVSATAVTSKLLTGLTTGVNTPILATDSILTALENLQAQISFETSNAITALTGDGTATGPGSVAFTLATVNSNVGTFGNQTTVAQFTVNGKGLITAAANVTIGNLTNSNLSGSAGITGANIASATITGSNIASATIAGTNIANNTITNTNLAQMPANTVKANTSGVPATPNDASLGTVTEATSSVLILTGWADATIGSPTIQVVKADATHNGYLSSTDWNTFNSTSGAAITALTGDATATGPGSVALTLATVNSNVGSFGSSTAIPTFTVNAKGLITAVSTNAVIAPAGTLTGTTLASNVVNSSLTSVGTIVTGVWNGTAIIGTYIANNTVANTNLTQMPANTVKANTTGSPATPVDTSLGTVTEATSAVLILTGWADATIGSPTIQVVKADATHSGYLSSTDWNTFNNTTASAITALTGDVAATGPGSVTATIQANVVTYAKFQQVAASSLIGNPTGVLANAQGITLGATLTFVGSALQTLAHTGDVTSSANSFVTTVAKIQGTTVTGTTGSGNVVFSASPTFTGTITAAAISASSLTDTSLTPGSVVFVGAGGLLTQDNSKFYWDDTNFTLGIGTIPASTTVFDIVNNTGAVKAIQSTSYGFAAPNRGRYANGTLASPTAATTGNSLHSFSARGYGATGFATASTGVITIAAGATFTDTSMPTYISLSTTPSASVTAAERMRINSTGNVLVGTTTDNATDLLQVSAGIISTYHKLAGSVSGYLNMTVPSTVSTYTLVWPSAQGAAGTVPTNDGLGNLAWSNPNTNIDGGRPDSVYTAIQFINGGTP